MTTPPKTRDLAHRLLAYEAVTGKTSEPMESKTLCVYEKLRHSLSAVAGVTSFYSLACRALVLAKSEASSLGAAQIAADGSLRDFGGFEPQTDMDRDRAQRVPGWRARSHSHRPLTRPAFSLPWRSLNVEPAAQCVAR